MPFTVDQFLIVMEEYNLAVWPLQIIFNILAVVMVFFLFKKSKSSNKFISAALSFFWLWIGVIYHLLFFTTINNAAYLFGVLFIVQAIIFFYFGLFKDSFQFEKRSDWIGIIGWVFLIYALIIYPILGSYFGHEFPRNPTFGLPCPTTIFTFGLLLFTMKRIQWYLILIPLIWSIIGTFAAINLTIYEDYGLGIAGVIGFIVIIATNSQRNNELNL